MPIHNSDIADIFSQIADFLEILGDNPFRIRAYRNASRTVGSFSKNISDMIANNEDLTQFPGIGKDLAGKIREIVETGTLDFMERLRKKLPSELIKLMNIAGLGPKKVAKLYKELGITNIEQLKKAIDSQKIFELEGFGEKTAQNIIEEINRLEQKESERFMISAAQQYAQSIVEYLKKAEGINDVSIAGSLRRRRDTIRDIDILVTCENSAKVMEHFVKYDEIQKVLSKGKTKSTVLLRSNLQVDVRAVPQESFGSALQYFTGSKEHSIELRKIAIKKKYKLNEYGVFSGDKQIAGKKEEDVYKSLGLPYIEPELRENRGEIEAALNGKLPNLITFGDIKGDLHMHSNYTDGHASIAQMAQVAKKKGYSYIAITDHSQHITVAGGLKPHDLKKQISEINKTSVKGITILKGSEIDILEDGSLDLPDEILKQLDVRICSVHYKFNLSKEKQTQRIIKAMDNPYFNILAHPTGRLINKREPYDIDIEKIMQAAKEKNCILELNSFPDRLDINDIFCKMAKDIGVKIAINTDAHRPGDLDFMHFGIGQARRGWLEPKDVINTLPLAQLKKILKR
ncbi:MAG: DNA polymerase III [Planctomycetes bacterium GWF2_41_51]|nr:MAG: DNA polymerase III [Planctomycetes bacterium GWF2_41_51]HBG25515.1 DNA polymerase/3'-5' exonuclease PolX [Phycisphaerales bacterium]